MDQPLITVDAALQALASANTPDELITLANQAAALQVYAKRAKLGMVAQNRCAEVRLRAERKLGELLRATPRLHGRPKSVPAENALPRLSDLGVPDRKLSHRAQRLAAIPQREFDAWLHQALRQQFEITTRLLLTICEQRRAAARNRKRIVGGRVADLSAFARKHKMRCIMIDPPWPNGGWVLPYLTTTLDELEKLPIRDLAAPDRCHLHVWTLPNENMFALKPIIEGWGFRLVSSLAWVKPATLGRGNYWRISHEILLTAVWPTKTTGSMTMGCEAGSMSRGAGIAKSLTLYAKCSNEQVLVPGWNCSLANSCRVGSPGDTRLRSL